MLRMNIRCFCIIRTSTEFWILGSGVGTLRNIFYNLPNVIPLPLKGWESLNSTLWPKLVGNPFSRWSTDEQAAFSDCLLRDAPHPPNANAKNTVNTVSHGSSSKEWECFASRLFGFMTHCCSKCGSQTCMYWSKNWFQVCSEISAEMGGWAAFRRLQQLRRADWRLLMLIQSYDLRFACLCHFVFSWSFTSVTFPESGAVTGGNAGPPAEGLGEQCSVTVKASGLHLRVAREGILKQVLNLGKLHGERLKKLQMQFDSDSFSSTQFPWSWWGVAMAGGSPRDS